MSLKALPLEIPTRICSRSPMVRPPGLGDQVTGLGPLRCPFRATSIPACKHPSCLPISRKDLPWLHSRKISALCWVVKWESWGSFGAKALVSHSPGRCAHPLNPTFHQAELVALQWIEWRHAAIVRPISPISSQQAPCTDGPHLEHLVADGPLRRTTHPIPGSGQPLGSTRGQRR